MTTEIVAPEVKGRHRALAISLSQIVHGDYRCDHCGNDAHVAVQTGADPEFAPLCWEAARDLTTATVGLFDQWWRNAD